MLVVLASLSLCSVAACGDAGARSEGDVPPLAPDGGAPEAGFDASDGGSGGSLELASDTLDFFFRRVGTTCPAGRDRAVEVRNRGPADVTIVTAIVTPSVTSAAFTVVEPLPRVVPAGGSAVMHVAFEPDAVASYAGTLTLNDDRGGAYGVTLSGKGTAEAIAVLWPLSLDFGAVHVGATAEEEIHIGADADENRTIEAVSIAGDASGFSVAFPGPMPFGSCFETKVTVRFSPTTAGPADTNVIIESLSGGLHAMQRVAVRGEGVPNAVPAGAESSR